MNVGIDGELRRAKFPAIATLDTSATPKAGERRIEAKALASIDLTKVREALASVSTPTNRSKKGWREATAAWRERVQELLRPLDPPMDAVDRLTAPPPAPAVSAPPPNVVVKKTASVGKTEDMLAATTLGAERRPLGVLARAYPGGMTEAQWSVAAGMKRSGGTWGTYKSRLKTAGLIEQRDGQWLATDAAILALGDKVEAMPAPGAELIEFWISRISGVGPMLREIARVYPRGYARTDLATALDMSASGGTFGTYLSRLRSAGLIEDRAGLIVAARSLMEGA